MRRITDQDLRGTGRLLESRGEVHRLPGHEAMVACRSGCNNLAAVHTRTNLKAHAPLQLELTVEAFDLLSKLDGGTDGAKSIVLVHRWHAEHRHHRIANEFLNRPTVTLEHVRSSLEVPNHHSP
jgi:hypothetical protein